MTNEPLVSVIIPTYKRSDFILRALNSVLKQTYKNIELIIVDDNDGENEYRKETRAKVAQFLSGTNFQYIEHPQNLGISEASNTGIKKAKGEYVAFLHDDDEWLENKLKLQVEKLYLLPIEYGLVYCGRLEMRGVEEKKIYPTHQGDVSNILGVNYIGSPSLVLIRKEVFNNVGFFDPLLSGKEDIDMYLRISKLYKISYIKDILVKYYIHTESISSDSLRKVYLMECFIAKHYEHLKKSNRVWSEVNERLGEIYAINGLRYKSFKSFLLSYLFNPLNIKILAKILRA